MSLYRRLKLKADGPRPGDLKASSDSNNNATPPAEPDTTTDLHPDRSGGSSKREGSHSDCGSSSGYESRVDSSRSSPRAALDTDFYTRNPSIVQPAAIRPTTSMMSGPSIGQPISSPECTSLDLSVRGSNSNRAKQESDVSVSDASHTTASPAHSSDDKFSWLSHYTTNPSAYLNVQTRLSNEAQQLSPPPSVPAEATSSLWNMQQFPQVPSFPCPAAHHANVLTHLSYLMSNYVEEDKEMCAICNDRSSGLHYGIYTCEGCKGFFKRTVQNKRRYSCVSGTGVCLVTKEQRNRCQFCRFQKCLQQGMVLEAVREDRMPGGRNGSAIYSLYKMKQKKNRQLQAVYDTWRAMQRPVTSVFNSNAQVYNQNQFGLRLPLVSSQPELRRSDSGSAQTSTEQLTNLVLPVAGMSRVANTPPMLSLSFSNSDQPLEKNLIEELLENDHLEEAASLKGLRDAPNASSDPAACLARVGDEIVEKLVAWTKKLPFYADLDVTVHTQLLVTRWAELVLLNTTFFAYKRLPPDQTDTSSDKEGFGAKLSATSCENNMELLRRRLSAILRQDIPLCHLRRGVGPLVEQMTLLLRAFQKLNLSHEAFVCVKAITLLHKDPPAHSHIRLIQDKYVKALQIHLSQCERGTTRLTDILTWLPQVHVAAAVLLESRMFYVPFLLCNPPDVLAPTESHCRTSTTVICSPQSTANPPDCHAS